MNSKCLLGSDEIKPKEVKNIEVNSVNINNTSLENESNFNKNNNNNNLNKNNNEEIDNDNLDKEKIYVIINKKTEKLMNSKKKTDLIQCALEYNCYLIENLIKEKNNISKIENDTALDRLYQNLNVLSESFELYENKHKLICNNGKNNIIIKDKNNKNNKDNKDINKNNEEQINNIDRIYSNSITNIKMELPL